MTSVDFILCTLLCLASMPCCHVAVPSLKSHRNAGGIHFFSNESGLNTHHHAEDFLSATMAIAYRATAFLCRWMSRKESVRRRERILAVVAVGVYSLR